MATQCKTTAAPVVIVAVLLLVVLPMLYVASIGPAVGLKQRGMISPAVEKHLERFYLPLAMAAKCPPAGDALLWYLGLWMPDPPQYQ